MSVPVDPKLREALRGQYITGPESTLPAHIGYFLMWFGTAEVGITTLLALILKLGPMDRIEYLVRGMDARVKCERVREAAASLYPLGPNLDARLKYFQETIVPIRNGIAHSWTVMDAKTKIVSFRSAGKVISSAHNDPKVRRMTLDELMDYGIWVHAFGAEIFEVITGAVDEQPLEIVDPTTGLPTAPPMDRPPKEPSARMRKRARRRLGIHR